MECQNTAKREEYSEVLRLKKRLKRPEEMVRLEDDLRKKTERKTLFKIPGLNDYYVDFDGCVFSVKVHKLKIAYDEYGYKKVYCREPKTKKKHYTVHRILASTFLVKNNSSDEVRHLDGNRENISLLNLEWGSRKDNIADKIRHQTFYRGGKRRKVNTSQVEEIRKKHGHGESLKSIGRFFNISAQHVASIVYFKKRKFD